MESICRLMALVNENMQGLVLFSHINRQGSLTAAAQLLGMSRSSVSKQLAALEKKSVQDYLIERLVKLY
ncbi:helix-turn-helix domain-containing protein [Shewanella woodyi]|uniref:helix-turn-helix domain-containing protein n=1 Tax=Shewanella woodyi TaxID=60961 RepID=UPI0037489D41